MKPARPKKHGTAGCQIASLLPEQAVVLKGATPHRQTSTSIHEYGEPITVYHADLYRLETAEQVRRLGLEEWFDRLALLLVDWGERFPHLFPGVRFEIRLMHLGDDKRRIVYQPA